MDEYISKEAVLSKCDDIWNAADTTTQTGVDTINTIDEITDFIESLPTADVQPVDRWIKADVSLPVYDGMVLVCDKSKNIRLGIYTDMGWCSQFGNPMMCKITHWQPLPKPPKDGDTNG